MRHRAGLVTSSVASIAGVSGSSSNRRNHSLLDRLAGVTCPTLVIVGEQDRPFIKPSRRMAETIPGAKLEVLADAGHSPQFESPDEWFRAVLPFLDSL